MVQKFSVISVGMEKEEYVLMFSKIFENFPVEWNVPFELLPENSGFSVQMVSGPGLNLFVVNHKLFSF